MSKIHYQFCPACNSNQIQPVLAATDHTVSGTAFEIWECANCTLRFTQDVPDATAIAPYYQSENYISHSDTNKGLVNYAYHLVRRFTLKNKRKLIGRLTGKSRGHVLDIGAGTGAFLNEMKDHGWQVTGIEPDPGARSVARHRYQLELQDASAFYGLPAGTYDVITLWHVLEHVHDLHPYLRHLETLLAPGGILLLALPNYTSGDAKQYGAWWAAYDVPRHLYHFSPASVKALLSQYGFTVSSLHAMWFDSFYISMLSEQYKNKGQKGYLRAVMAGLRSNSKAIGSPEAASSIIYCARRKG